MLFSFFLFRYFYFLLPFCVFSISVLPPLSELKLLRFFFFRYGAFFSLPTWFSYVFASIRDLHFSFFLICDYSEVRLHFPFVSFLFSRLGALLRSTRGYPEVGSFIPRDSALRLVLADLPPLLCQSLDWFRFIREISIEVRSSELDTG